MSNNQLGQTPFSQQLGGPGGGGGLSSLVAGQLVYGGAGGAAAQSSFLTFDEANGRVGIGGAPVANAGTLQVHDGTAEACTGTSELMFSCQGATGARCAVRNTGSNQEGTFRVSSSGNVLVGAETNTTFALIHNATTRATFDGTKLLMASGQNFQMGGGRILASQGSNVAIAATITLGSGNHFRLTGAGAVDYITTTTWSFGATFTVFVPSGGTLNHNSASPGGSAAKMLLGANISGAANGTVVTLVYDSTGDFICSSVKDL